MRRLLALLSLLVLFTACGGESITSTENSLSGTYTLKTVNGAPLPFVLAQQGTSKSELLSDAFTFKADGTYTRATTSRTTVGTVVTPASQSETGTWARNGTNFAILDNAAGSSRITGTITATGFTFNDVGFIAVYSK